MIQYGEEQEPDYRHASIDLFLDPAHHGKGLGRMPCGRSRSTSLDEVGHHRSRSIQPSTTSPQFAHTRRPAFGRVGVMRSSWRDPDGGWHDSLLMELVVTPAG